MQFLDLVAIQVLWGFARVQPPLKQDFVGVNVSNPCYGCLVCKSRFETALLIFQKCFKIIDIFQASRENEGFSSQLC